MDFTKQSPVILSLCTGMRGLERGIERAMQRQHQYDSDNGEGAISQVHNPITVAAFVEIEAFVIENLVRQMEQGVLDPTPVWSNLKTFPSEQFHRKVHGITGGYPCQPFSVAGKRGGQEDPRHLWPHIKRMVGTVRPLWCFFENVPGHLTLGYREVRSDLEQLGYTVEEGIFSAEEVGAPHQRKRLFILAVDNAYRQRLKQEYQIQTRRNTVEYAGEGELEHSKSGRPGELRNKTGERKGYGASGASGVLSEDELADTKYDGHLTTEERSIDEAREGSGEAGKNHGEQLEGCSGSELANTNGSGSGEDTERSKLRTEGIEQSSGNCGRTNERENEEEQITRWPARPGEQQYEWEEARTFSSVGFAVNGYNFRDDLLRLLGNSVVEQTAEKAWIELWKKM